MTLSTYLLCFVSGLLGICFHIFAIKIPAVKTRATVANVSFSWTDYLKDDLAAILASVITVIAALVLLDEIIAFKPGVEPFIKAGFFFLGFTGSSVLISILGQAQSKLNAIIDIKTNIADQVAQPVPPADIKVG